MTTFAERLNRSWSPAGWWRALIGTAPAADEQETTAVLDHVYRSAHVEPGDETTALGRYIAAEREPVRPAEPEPLTGRLPQRAFAGQATLIFDELAAAFGVGRSVEDEDRSGDVMRLPTLDQIHPAHRLHQLTSETEI